MEAFFGSLFVAQLIGSIVGGIYLATRVVANPIARFFLSLVFMVVFAVVGTTAVIAGCTTVTGPVNFH